MTASRARRETGPNPVQITVNRAYFSARDEDAGRYNQLMSSASAASSDDLRSQAESWLQRLAAQPPGAMPLEANAPQDPAPLLAALCEAAIAKNQSMWLLVADDQLLPELSNALDLAARPLCLVLPASDFTARIALRASLSLLKSRLNRAVDEGWQGAWHTQQQRLSKHQELWQAALAWSASERSNAWPDDLGDLFPIRIAPVQRALQLGGKPAELVLMLEREPLPINAEEQLSASRVLIFNAPPPVVPFLGAVALLDKELQLRAQVEAVTREIAELELELATAQGELSEFSLRYHDAIGSRMTELDALQAELALRLAAKAPDDPRAKEHAEAAKARAEESKQEEARYREAAKEAGHEAGKRFSPSGDLKKLFRQVAQKIHPDRARDEADRAWRTKLMAEANRAYRSGDTATLREVLAVWQEGQPAEALLRTDDNLLERQLERLKERLAAIQKELDALYASRLYELYQAERQARRQQRNLLEELATQFDLQIDAAKARLAELEPAPSDPSE